MKAVYARTRTGAGEDVAVTTHDFYKTGSDFTGGEVTTIAGHWDTFWTAIKTVGISTNCTLTELRFYNGYNGDGTPGEADFIFARSAAGGASGAMLPPQVACSVTERTPYRRHWGRYYLPGIAAAVLNNDGTLINSWKTTLIDQAKIFYDAINAMPDIQNTVWGRTGVILNSILGSTTDLSIPHPWPVLYLRVDEILDVVRRRRYETVTSRLERTLVI
jgi:hypothetical protein